MLVLAVSFMMVLSLAVNCTYAARPTRGEWDGLQIPDLYGVYGPLPKITGEPGEGYVIIEGAIMMTMSGYSFGEKGTVAYEVIDWMIMFVDIMEYASLTQEELATVKRFGQFTWYCEVDGEFVELGEGRFRAKGQKGHLWVRGDGLHVKGTFWTTESGMWHEGWYMITDDS